MGNIVLYDMVGCLCLVLHGLIWYVIAVIWSRLWFIYQELDGLLTSTFQFNRLRGCSVAFGYLAVKRFLENNDLQCVIRAHAVQEDGYYRHFEKALNKRAVGEEGEEGG